MTGRPHVSATDDRISLCIQNKSPALFIEYLHKKLQQSITASLFSDIWTKVGSKFNSFTIRLNNMRVLRSRITRACGKPLNKILVFPAGRCLTDSS